MKIKKILYYAVIIMLFVLIITIATLITLNIDKILPDYIENEKEYITNNTYNLNFPHGSKYFLTSFYYTKNGMEFEELDDYNYAYDNEIFKKMDEFCIKYCNESIKKYIIAVVLIRKGLIDEIIRIVSGPTDLIYTQDGKNIMFSKTRKTGDIEESKQIEAKDDIVNNVKDMIKDMEIEGLEDINFDYISFDNNEYYCQLEDTKNNIYVHYDTYNRKLYEFIYGFKIDEKGN